MSKNRESDLMTAVAHVCGKVFHNQRYPIRRLVRRRAKNLVRERLIGFGYACERMRLDIQYDKHRRIMARFSAVLDGRHASLGWEIHL